MCWAGLFQVDWVRKPSVAVQFLGWPLEPGIGRSSEGCIMCLLARSSFASLERAIASSIDLRAVLIRLSESFFARASEVFVFEFLARACSRVADLKHCILGSSEVFVCLVARATKSSLERACQV